MDLLSERCTKWQTVLNSYQSALSIRSHKMKEAKRQELLLLDKWYQESLPVTIQDRPEKHVTLSELSKLMKWKLSRGKFRPRLQQMVESNTEDDVVRASKKAFQFLPNLKAAIEALTVLKAVGPATASAVLAAGAPEHVAFMADESMIALPGLQPLQYTLNFFMAYMEQIKIIVKRLKKDDESWTPHKVELALWTYQILKTNDPESIENLGTDTISEKRKSSLSANEEIPPKHVKKTKV